MLLWVGCKNLRSGVVSNMHIIKVRYLLLTVKLLLSYYPAIAKEIIEEGGVRGFAPWSVRACGFATYEYPVRHPMNSPPSGFAT